MSKQIEKNVRFFFIRHIGAVKEVNKNGGSFRFVGE